MCVGGAGMRRGTPEGAVLRQITDYLSAKRVWWTRMNTGSFPLGEGKSRRFFKAGRKGMADLLAWVTVPYTSSRQTALWIEVKSKTGAQTDDQKAFQEEVEAAGMYYILARDVSDLQKAGL